jgi:hypothetical protein
MGGPPTMPTLRLELLYLCEHATSAVQMPRKLWLIPTMIAKQSRPRHVTKRFGGANAIADIFSDFGGQSRAA